MKKKLLTLLFAAVVAVAIFAVGCNTSNGGNAHTQHNYLNYVSDNNATCTTDGTETAKCTGCDKTDTRVVTNSKLNHNFIDYKPDNNATCRKDGTKTATCSRENCTVTDTVTDEGTKLNHNFLNYVSDNNATCTADGTKTAICANDGCNEEDTLPDAGSKLSHNFVDGECKTCQAPDPDCKITDAEIITALEENCIEGILETISPWVTLNKNNIVESNWYFTKDSNGNILSAENVFKYQMSETEAYYKVVKLEFNKALTKNNANFENIKNCEDCYTTSTYLNTIQSNYKSLTNAICDKLFGEANETTQRFIINIAGDTTQELGITSGFKVIEIKNNIIKETRVQIKEASTTEGYISNFNNGLHTTSYGNKQYEISGEKLIAEV